MAGLTLTSIGKLYGEVRAIRDVNVEVRDGEFLVLVGPSGCGKSTLLRMIAGLEEISEGELRIGGERVNDRQPKDRDIAMVFQSYALYPHMTVRQNMGFGLKVRKIPQDEIDRRVKEAGRLLDLLPLMERLPKQMSGGQRQRVAMGRAIVRDPKVFLFDEPLSNLDAALRSQMRGELKRLHERLGATMIYVTHDQVEAMTLADRICVLKSGEVQQVGTPQELYDRPANRFVAGFIGAPAMNFLSCEVDTNGLLQGRSWALQIPEGGRPRRMGKLVVGVRPHDLMPAGDGIPGTVELVEPTGWEAHVHVDVDGTTVLMRVETKSLGETGPGDTVHLIPKPGTLRFFAPGEAGEAVGTA